MSNSSLCYDELETPIGSLTIVMSHGKLCRLDYGSMQDNRPKLNTWAKRYFLCSDFVKDSSATENVRQELVEYFEGEREAFTLDYHFNGTPFQKKVWHALVEHVPYGETRSYKDISQCIQAPKAIRAVGGAINKNPIAIIIPCHRVIGSNGSLVGYNGGLDKKKHLLQLEKAPVTY